MKVIGNTQPIIDSEKEYRKKLVLMARTIGCEQELFQIFNKYDKLLCNCTNMQERKAIGTMGVLEIHNLLNGSTSVGNGGDLTIDGQIIISG